MVVTVVVGVKMGVKVAEDTVTVAPGAVEGLNNTAWPLVPASLVMLKL